MAETSVRFVALDLHKDYVMLAALDAQQQVVLAPRRVLLPQFDGWAKRHLRPTDQVVLEATTNGWYVHDLLQPLVARVVVADPAKAKAKMGLPVKTDRRDTLGLAELLVTNTVPVVWVPPPPVRELRSLIAHRRQLVQQRRAAKNRLRSLLQRHQIVPPDGQVFALVHRDWWTNLPLSPTEHLRTSQDLATIDHFGGLIAETERELARLSTCAPWADMVPWLIQLAGVGLITAMTILSAVGDITRFPSAKQLVGYSGLGAKIHASGQTHHSGGITKKGRTELRAALVEAAWAAVRWSAHWQQRFERLAGRIGSAKAIVAIARKLLVSIWHVLSDRVSDRDAEAPAVARRLLHWGARHGVATGLGLSRAAFIRQHLDRLGIGQDLDVLDYNRARLQLGPGCRSPTGQPPDAVGATPLSGCVIAT
ncbi:MAG TPA: IS110 family transposase [Herpetosiphonaceae bacterium]|nr:IS110 family transposase [Herpetosiphonaceae bacterium]